MSKFTSVIGPAGTGKTEVTCGHAEYAFGLGLHVVTIAPTNPACDRFHKKLNDLQARSSATPDENKPVRLHRFTSESSHATQYGSDVRPPRALNDKQKTFDAQFEHNEAECALEIQIFQEAKNKSKKRAFKDPAGSLADITLQKAEAGNLQVMGKFDQNEGGSIFAGFGRGKGQVDLMAKPRNS